MSQVMKVSSTPRNNVTPAHAHPGDAREGALGLDVLDSLPPPGRSGNGTPVISGAVSLSTDKARPRNGRGKRSRDEEDEEEDEEEGEEEEIKPTKRSGLPGKNAGLLRPDGYDVDMADGDGIGLDGEVDSRIYCTCNQLGYGEMIACDDDDCAIEWVGHVLFLIISNSCPILHR